MAPSNQNKGSNGSVNSKLDEQISGKNQRGILTRSSSVDRSLGNKGGTKSQTQSTLNFAGKKVQFTHEVDAQQEEKKRDDEKRYLLRLIDDLKKEKVEIANLRKEMAEKDCELQRRMAEIEKRMNAFDERLNDCACDCNRGTHDGGEGSQAVCNERSRDSSVCSMRSRYSISSVLSEGEIRQMKKFLNEKDKSDRRDNIVIKGLQLQGVDLKREIMNFIDSRLGIQIEIVAAWRRGRIFIVKLKDFDQKLLIMRNKNKLKDTTFFIENDLTWDERKKQEEMIRWAKVQREKGRRVTIGYGRLMLDGKWYKWDEIEAYERNIDTVQENGSQEILKDGEQKNKEIHNNNNLF